MSGRYDTTTFLPLDSRIGGQNRDSPRVEQYLPRDQTKYMYKKSRDWEDNKCGHDTARNRARKTAR